MPQLKTEQNTLAMGRRVRDAAFNLNLGHIGDLNTFFEHGQWWVENRKTGAQWGACDAEGPESAVISNGFYFEQVTKGDSE